MEHPQSMTGANAVIEGIGTFGTLSKAELPKIEFVTWDSEAGLAQQTINTGILKPLTAKLTFEKYNITYYESMGKLWNEHSKIHIKHNVSGTDGHSQIIATFRGDIKVHEIGALEIGKKVELVFEINCTFYKLEIDGTEAVLADTEKGIARINGVDKYADIRSNIL